MIGAVRVLSMLVAAAVSHSFERQPARGAHPAQHCEGLQRFLWMSVAALVVCMLLSHAAVAAPGFTMFDPIENGARSTSNGWFNTILGMMRPTFLLLATIELCWAAAIWAFEKDSLNSLAVEMIKKFMFIGFFYALLQFAPTWLPTIADTFQTVGETAAGTQTITTDGIVAMGLQVIAGLWTPAIAAAATIESLAPEEIAGTSVPPAVWADAVANFNLAITTIVALTVAVAYVVVAAQYFTLKLESYVLLAAGAVFLGLGSSSWTKEYVSKYLNYAINTGVRLLVLILILSLTLNAVRSAGGFVVPLDVPSLLKVFVASILQAILAMKAPEMAGALLSGGGVGLSAGSAAQGARGLGSAVKSTVARGASALQGMGNLSKAVSAGRQLAEQKGQSGAASTLSGLGAALRQTARELPGSVMNAVKAKGGAQGGIPGAGRGQNPGPIDRAAQALRGLSGGGGGGGGSPGGAASGIGSLASPAGAGEAGKSLSAEAMAAAAYDAGVANVSGTSNSEASAPLYESLPPPYEVYSQGPQPGETPPDSTPLSTPSTSSTSSGSTSGAPAPRPLGPSPMPGGTSPLSTLRRATASRPVSEPTRDS